MKKHKGEGKIVKLKKKQEPLLEGLDFTLLFAVLILLVLGLTMLFSVSSAANMVSGDVYSPIIKQAALAVVGLIAMFALSRYDYRKLQKLSGIMYIISAAIMLLVGFIGIDSHGARRQISIGIGTLQPSEFSKYVLIIWLATRLAGVKKSERKTWNELIVDLVAIGIPVAECLLVQRHASAAIVHMFIGVAMIVAAGVDWKKLIPIGAVGVGAMLVVILGTGFRMDRITSFLNFGSDSQGIDWQTKQSILAVGSGGLFGEGLGNSKQKYSYLPEAENDYIFAIVGEELGFIGSVMIVALFCIVIWRGISIALNTKDAFGTYTAFGITVLIGFQVLVNMCVVLQLMPSTGMQLPLFSSGGSSMLATLAGIGVLLSVSKYGGNTQNSLSSGGVEK